MNSQYTRTSNRPAQQTKRYEDLKFRPGSRTTKPDKWEPDKGEVGYSKTRQNEDSEDNIKQTGEINDEKYDSDDGFVEQDSDEEKEEEDYVDEGSESESESESESDSES